MALSIKDGATDNLARQVAALTGESITEAVTVALRERLARLEREGRAQQVAAEIAAIGAAVRRELKEPVTSTDHGALLYDEQGLPR
jgi:antitoxin VapB